jgi:alpha-galactosidase
LPGDDSSSDADDEDDEIQMKFKDFKKKLERGHIASPDDVILEGSTAMPAGFEDVMDEGNDTPYEDSSDEEDESMDEFDSDGHLVRKENNCARFKKTSGTPHFDLGMKFRSKKQFKKAIIRYDIAERKVINIIKDEAKRVRAKCDWHVCPWVCLLSNNTRTESWQIVTFNDNHTLLGETTGMLQQEG